MKSWLRIWEQKRVSDQSHIFDFGLLELLEIYWAKRPKPSVGSLLVIEADLVLGRLGLSSIYTLLGSHCNKSSKSKIIVNM